MKQHAMAQVISQAAEHASSRPRIATTQGGDGSANVRSVVPSRAGKKPITGFFDPMVSRQIKKVALDKDTTMQELLQEALNDLFRKYGLPPIA